MVNSTPEQPQIVPDEEPDTRDVYLSEADAGVLMAVFGHPYQLPTLPELVHANGDRDKELIKRRIRRLIEQGVLEEVTFENGSPSPKLPDKFYGATDLGERLFRRRVPERREWQLQEAYARAEKPKWIERCERAPRPPR